MNGYVDVSAHIVLSAITQYKKIKVHKKPALFIDDLWALVVLSNEGEILCDMELASFVYKWTQAL